MNKATVSAVVAQLENERLIIRKAKENHGKVGRPEVALYISEKAGIFVGVRLEPSTIRLIATTLDGGILRALQVPGSRDITAATKQLKRAVHDLVRSCRYQLKDVRALGVGIPGMIDHGGRLALAPNLGWRDLAVCPLIQDVLPMPISIDNDTNAAALAEKLFGACKDIDDFIYVTGHSGVGGGLFLKGKLYRGAAGFGGELGHMKVVPGGRACGCGGRGCLEAYASEAAILARAAERNLHLDDVWALAECAREGDDRVLELLCETGAYLGQAIANLINVFNPQRIVLGGNLAVVAEYIVPSLERVLARDTLAPLHNPASILVSPLRADSVPMGGIALALEGFLASPLKRAPS